MLNFDLSRLTALTYSIFAAAFVLLSLSIAEIVLEDRTSQAYHDVQVQYPGSSLAEWLFVPMRPRYIDTGPMTAKFIAAPCSMFSSLAGMAWIAAHWLDASERKRRKLGLAACIASVINGVAATGFMIFVLVRESQNKLPRYFIKWNQTAFTKEFWICTAIPSIFKDNANRFFGFSACEFAKASKYILLCICCVSAILAGLSVLQARKVGVFSGSSQKLLDPEQATPPKPMLKSNELPRSQRPLIRTASVPLPANVRVPIPPTCAKVNKSPLHGFYARLR